MSLQIHTLRDDGDCYEAAAVALLMPEYAGGIEWLPEDTVLVHGTPILECPPYEEFGHAWLETHDMVFDFSNGLNIVMRKEQYYEKGKIDPDNCTRYTREQARRMLLEHKHYGCWEED